MSKSEVNTALNITLIKIINLYALEYNGEFIDILECFNYGEGILELSDTTNDEKIIEILKKVAQLCESELYGSDEHLINWINENDVYYIADLLGEYEIIDKLRIIRLNK